MNPLLIFGTGAHARKVFHCAVGSGLAVRGFVDENPEATSPVAEVPLLSPAELPLEIGRCVLFVAIGRGEVRRRLMQDLETAGWTFPAIVHPRACVAPDAVLGAGTLVAAQAVVESGARVGRGTIVDIGVLIDHDCTVDEFLHIRPGEVLAPYSTRTADHGAT